MNSEPAAAVNTFGDQLAAILTGASLPTTKPSLGKVVPSEQTAHAAFCAPSDRAVVVASRVRRNLPGGEAPMLLLPTTEWSDELPYHAHNLQFPSKRLFGQCCLNAISHYRNLWSRKFETTSNSQ